MKKKRRRRRRRREEISGIPIVLCILKILIAF
jgi:hypothetical protein